MLHEAASRTVTDDDARYFNILLDLGFPMYDTDRDGDFAAFTIAKIKGDGVFLEAFKAL